MTLHQALGLTSLAAVLVLAGCTQPVRPDPPAPPAPAIESKAAVESTAPPAPRAAKPRPAPRRTQPPAGSEELPVTPAEPERESTGSSRPAGSLTGVPVCDRYLASFKQCHTTIGQSSPAQIDERYDRLRQALSRKSGTPEGRAVISKMCKDFAAGVATALDGRTCGDPPR